MNKSLEDRPAPVCSDLCPVGLNVSGILGPGLTQPATPDTHSVGKVVSCRAVSLFSSGQIKLSHMTPFPWIFHTPGSHAFGKGDFGCICVFSRQNKGGHICSTQAVLLILSRETLLRVITPKDKGEFAGHHVYSSDLIQILQSSVGSLTSF